MNCSTRTNFDLSTTNLVCECSLFTKYFYTKAKIEQYTSTVKKLCESDEEAILESRLIGFLIMSPTAR